MPRGSDKLVMPSRAKALLAAAIFSAAVSLREGNTGRASLFARAQPYPAVDKVEAGTAKTHPGNPLPVMGQAFRMLGVTLVCPSAVRRLFVVGWESGIAAVKISSLFRGAVRHSGYARISRGAEPNSLSPSPHWHRSRTIAGDSTAPPGKRRAQTTLNANTRPTSTWTGRTWTPRPTGSS